MRRPTLQFVLVAACAALVVCGRAETVTLSDGSTKEGRISVDGAGSLRVVEASQYGEVATTYSPDKVAGIEFALPADSAEVLAAPAQSGLDGLRKTWRTLEPFLAFAPAQIAPVGVAYARTLLEDRPGQRAAREILEKLKALAEPPKDLAGAILLVEVEAAIKEGDIETAQGMIDSATKADAAVFENMSRVAGQFKLVNADLDRKKYEELVEEWPKWELMPEIVEQRRRLIDAALDGYLYPVAFSPEPAELTASGLAKAGNLLAATGDVAEARLRYQDIVDNFPIEPQLTEAVDFLADHPAESE